MKYNITPVTKPRQTRSDKWKQRPCVMRYRAFADECRLNNVEVPACGASIEFYLPMPKSWPKKKKQEMNGKPHTQTPDIDNLLKSLLDAVYKNDSHVWHIGGLSKFWAYDGCIVVNLDIDDI